MSIIQTTDLPGDRYDIPIQRVTKLMPRLPFKVGASLGGAAGLNTFRAYTQWMGTEDLIASDYFARAQWSDIEAPNFIFNAWVPWQKAYPDNWIALTVNLLPNTLNYATAQNWTDGANGVHDAHFSTLGDNIVASGLKNIILRLDHEFNLQPIPGGSAANWVTYWKRVVNILREKFTAASGVRMMTCWNPSNNIGGFDLNAFWPGNTRTTTVTGGLTGGRSTVVAASAPLARRYACGEVDYIGIDIYDQNPGDSLYTNSVTPTDRQRHDAFRNYTHGFEETAGYEAAGQLIYMQRLSTDTTTPLCVPEWGCWEVGGPNVRPAGGDNPIFIRKMYEWMVQAGVAWANYFDYTNLGLDASHQLWPGLNNTFSSPFPRAMNEYLRLFAQRLNP